MKRRPDRLPTYHVLVPQWYVDGSFTTVQSDGSIAKVNFYSPVWRVVAEITARTAPAALRLAKQQGFVAPIISPVKEPDHASHSV